MVERWTRDRKVASSNPGRMGGEFSSLGLTICAVLYLVCFFFFTHVLPQRHVGDPVHFANSAGGRLQVWQVVGEGI